MSDPADPRAELGSFLRTRREQLNPRDLGFPVAGRRRTPGLRREEVAVAAGLSTTWYTCLEQGRAKDVSPSVLDSLARVLQLSEDERRYIHILMHGHVPANWPIQDDTPFRELFRQIVTLADQSSFPVYSLDRACEVVAWNTATTEWLEDWGSVPPAERNFMLWLFCSPKAREVIVEWEDFARDVVARWRLDLAKSPYDEFAMKRVAELKRRSSEFSRLWEGRHVLEHRINVRHLRHPRLGVRSFYGFALFTAYEEQGGVLFYIPSELKSLRFGRATDASPIPGKQLAMRYSQDPGVVDFSRWPHATANSNRRDGVPIFRGYTGPRRALAIRQRRQ